MYLPKKPYYQILGISAEATTSEIQAAWRKLAKELHPDLNGGAPGKEDRLKEVNEAYKTLIDEARRRAYDADRSRARRTAPPTPASRSPRTPILRVPVRSTAFRAIGYDEYSERLEVEFNNKSVVQYMDVPSHLYSEFLNADSKGQFYHDRIVGQFRERCVK